MLEKGAKSHTAAASTGKMAPPRDQAPIVSPIIPDASYPHHSRGIASVTSLITDVRITYKVVAANAGQFVKWPMARYRNMAGSRAPAEINTKYVGKCPLMCQRTSAATAAPAAANTRRGES